jgi:hypothetical protein
VSTFARASARGEIPSATIRNLRDQVLRGRRVAETPGPELHAEFLQAWSAEADTGWMDERCEARRRARRGCVEEQVRWSHLSAEEQDAELRAKARESGIDASGLFPETE